MEDGLEVNTERHYIFVEKQTSINYEYNKKVICFSTSLAKTRAGFNEEKKSRSTFLIGLNGKIRVWVPPETTYCSVFVTKSEKRGMSHNARLTNTDESRRERRNASSRARRRQSLFFFTAQGRKVSPSSSLAWAEGALKCYPRNSDGGAAIEVLSVSSVFWVYPSVLVLFGRSNGLKNGDWDRHEFLWGGTAGVRCAMVCGRGHDWCPGHHSLRFTIYRISRGRR